MPGKARKAQRAAKRQRKSKNYRPDMPASERSAYGRKKRFLDAHGGRGSDYPLKPWK
jgi:hypothetical protein